MNSNSEDTWERSFISTSVDFELVSGLIVLKARVDERYGDFILDTGSSSVLINQKVENGNILLGGIDTDFRAEEIEVNEISIGNVLHPVDEVLAVDLSIVESTINRPIAGIIGSQVLMQYNVVVDYERGEVAFLNPNQSSFEFNPEKYIVTSLPFTLEYENLIILPVEINNKNRKFIFDTGAAINVGFDKDTFDQDGNNQLSLKGVRIDKIPFVNNSGQNLESEISSSYHGILSPYTLNAHKVIIDFKSSKVHLFFEAEPTS